MKLASHPTVPGNAWNWHGAEPRPHGCSSTTSPPRAWADGTKYGVYALPSAAIYAAGLPTSMCGTIGTGACRYVSITIFNASADGMWLWPAASVTETIPSVALNGAAAEP